jgi:hypothetical protein
MPVKVPEPQPEVEQHQIHDVPTLEQRIANLESVSYQSTIDIDTLRGNIADLSKKLRKVWQKVYPEMPPNCRHCGRQMMVAKGRPCPVCGRKQ